MVKSGGDTERWYRWRKEEELRRKRDISAPDLNTINLANLIDPRNSLYFDYIKFPALSLMALRRKFYKDTIVCFIEGHIWNDSEICEPDLLGLDSREEQEVRRVREGAPDCGILRVSAVVKLRAGTELIIKPPLSRYL